MIERRDWQEMAHIESGRVSLKQFYTKYMIYLSAQVVASN